MSKVQNIWEKEQAEMKKRNAEGIKGLTQQQITCLNESHKTMALFLSEYSDMFDVTSECARKMQDAFWSLRNNFNLDDNCPSCDTSSSSDED
tara:strand:+ start:64 stop:339 length:276 start_codon:yes stop_codon:yes gene_type:complete